MKVCPVCGSRRLKVLIILPGGDMTECDACGSRLDYSQLKDEDANLQE